MCEFETRGCELNLMNPHYFRPYLLESSVSESKERDLMYEHDFFEKRLREMELMNEHDFFEERLREMELVNEYDFDSYPGVGKIALPIKLLPIN
ncbi:hypothetical protein GEMRC1_006098 [Eukaryota sp. GEM-RC1]